MKKYPIMDVTFIFILSVDTIHRIENTLASVSFINRYFDTNTLVYEVSNCKTSILKKLLPKKVAYILKHDDDPVFYRTKYLNDATMLTNTEYVAIWDVDVIAEKNQIMQAVQSLRDKTYDFVYPYEEFFYDVPDEIRKMFIEKEDIKILEKTTPFHVSIYSQNPIGGAFIVNKQKYIEAGLENEHFYGWGPEDRERYIRWNKLEYKVGRTKGPLFHLHHPRGINSKIHSHIQGQIKDSEAIRINRMTKDKLQSEINGWSWTSKKNTED